MDLSAVSTSELERLRSAIAGGRVAFPLSRLGLKGEGLDGLVSQLAALNVLTREGAVAVVAAVLADRRGRPMRPELVWTGPEARQSGARDTAVVLTELLARATSTVLLAGFAFDHAAEILRPLSEALRRGVTCRLYADAAVASGFIKEHWPFGPPFPQVFGFVPEEHVFASLHAKCVVVDERWVLVTSANFTDRGQTRNVEVGVLLDDAGFAGVLEAQFVGGWFEAK